MNHLLDKKPSLDEIVSDLNHKMTGNLARLEGLYLLYKQEGKLQDELWEATLQQAKHDTFIALNQTFDLANSQHQPPLQIA